MLIFDFDQTLADTRQAAPLRQARNWSRVRAVMRNVEPYPGITGLLGELHAFGQPLAILTSSPDMVAKEFVQRHNWPIETILGYHQMGKRQKPDPHGINLALRQHGADAGTSYHVGDREQDTLASRAAGVIAIGAGWGSEEVDRLRASQPEQLFMSVEELRDFLLDVLGGIV